MAPMAPIATRGLATFNSTASPPTERPNDHERALLVHLFVTGDSDQDDLNELRLLARAAGAEVVGELTGRRQQPVAATFIGKGKVEELAALVRSQEADLVIVNHALSPAQERNLEKRLSCRVIDRTGLILDIFAQRAHSHEGKLQVELAQLEHLSTRLVRGWSHLERQKGGIGLRGPGETQLETDRRLLRERIKHLNKRLDKVRKQRHIRRQSRNKVPIPTVSLVGYTNAGKSSLFNALTGATIYAADQLFATLDPTMRRLEVPGNHSVILADTVGFIRHLPHDLVEAFKSTLEEVTKADLLLHVIDASSPEYHEHIHQVDKVLAEIQAQDIPYILVFNKIDLSGQAPRLEWNAQTGNAKVWLSAASGAGLPLLLDAIAGHYRRFRQRVCLRLPPHAARLRAQLYQSVEVVQESVSDSGYWLLELAMDPAKQAWMEQLPDYRPEYYAPESCVLAPTGS